MYIYIYIQKCIYDSGWARVPASAGRGPTQNDTKDMIKTGSRDSGWVRVPCSAGRVITHPECKTPKNMYARIFHNLTDARWPPLWTAFQINSFCPLS